MKKSISSTLLVVTAIGLSACGNVTLPVNTTAEDTLPPTTQIVESTTEPVEWFSSDALGLCFSYPQGYTPLPESDPVEIVAPELAGTDLRAIFWLEISEAYDRTAEVIANQDLTTAGVVVDLWNLTLDGEPAVVLDGMPGQDLQRRVYVVHQGTLYVLAFMPTRSQDTAAYDQMETLYNAITSSWVWSACSAGQ